MKTTSHSITAPILALLLGFSVTASMAYADTLLIPVSRQGGDLRDISMPVTGETQQSVRARYGTPDSTSGPTGDPPITRWNYTDFSVYFESETVIHSVLKHRPHPSVSESSNPE